MKWSLASVAVVALASAMAALCVGDVARAQLPPNGVLLAPNGNVGRPTIVHAGNEVHAFWSGTAGTWYNRSADGGLSWLAAEQLLAGAGFMGAAVEGRNVYCVVSSSAGPRLLRSQDGGSSWLPAVAISTQSVSPYSWPAGVWASAGNLAVVWQEQRPGVGSVFTNQSLDGGATWHVTDTCLDAGLGAGSVHFAADGPILHVFWSVWNSSANTPEVFHQRSLDHGTTWLSAPVLIGPGGVLDAAASGTTVLVANAAVGGYPADLLRSTDAGNTWGVLPGRRFSLIALSGNLAIGFEGSASPNVNRSLDGGATWLPANIQLPPVGGSEAQISIVNGTVAIGVRTMLWSFVYVENLWVSGDGGSSWPARAFLPVQVLGNVPVTIPLDDGHLVVDDQMRAYVVTGYGTYGSPKPGSGAIAPALTGAGVPMLGRSLNVTLSHALGGAPALVGFSFMGRSNTPWGSGTILVAPPVITVWSITSGIPNAPGAGAMTVPLTIPNNSAFAAMRLDLQGFVLDPAALDGVSSSAGLEMWIH